MEFSDVIQVSELILNMD